MSYLLNLRDHYEDFLRLAACADVTDEDMRLYLLGTIWVDTDLGRQAVALLSPSFQKIEVQGAFSTGSPTVEAGHLFRRMAHMAVLCDVKTRGLTKGR